MNKENRTMLTDLYQLTMNATYFDSGKNDPATFDLFIRKLPKDWGYFIANGIEDAIDYATNINFEADDIAYLEGLEYFKSEYLDFLNEFKFTGEIYAVKEGTPMPANTPLVRITGPRTEAQLIETALLNTINFQTMIATKANRVVQAAGNALIADFGLRRAQEKDAGMKGTRACYIAGVGATSNVLAGKEYGIPVTGTHAHSLVMTYPTELEAFKEYTKSFPDNSTLLIDTYDTIQGARNAIIIAKELERKGKKLGAVRIDSGNLADLSKQVRTILDKANLPYVKIIASNDLNEYKIYDLKQEGAKIDGYGVGTEMITAKPVAAIPGVYKIVEDENGAKIKLSADKKTYPGKKQVYRVEQDGKFVEDILALEGEKVEGKPLLEKIVENGKRIIQRRELNEIRDYCLKQVAKMPDNTKDVYATPYEMRPSQKLDGLVRRLTSKYKQEVKK